MNEAVALAPQDVGSVGLDDLLALVGLHPQRRTGKAVGVPEELLFQSIGDFVDGLLVRTISARTKGEFVATRDIVFGPYARAVTSLARLVKVVVPEPVIERIIAESFCELESDFREQGVSRFGTAAKDQAMFTIWTLRRTSRLINKVAAAGPISKDLKKQDMELAGSFSFYAAWTQFNLDCLVAAMRHDKPVQLDVLPEIIGGLRAAVNAYGYVRQGLDLRIPKQEPIVHAYEWDEEDQELLDSSMADMELETLDD